MICGRRNIKRLLFLIVAGAFYCTPSMASVLAWSTFVGLGGGSAVSLDDNQTNTGTVILGSHFSKESGFYGGLLLEAYRLQSYQSKGNYISSRTYHHNWEGIGLAVGVKLGTYDFWFSYKGGRLHSTQFIGNEQEKTDLRYLYYSVGIGMIAYIYDSDSADIGLLLQIDGVNPGSEWRIEHGQEDITIVSAGIGIKIKNPHS